MERNMLTEGCLPLDEPEHNVGGGKLVLLKSTNSKMIVGYDLGSTYSQISYCGMCDEQVETLSAVTGEECFNIPTVLCKRSQVNQWLYGKEALRSVSQGQGILIENLLELAVDGEEVQVEGVSYDPVALLTLFLKKSLGLFTMVASIDKIGAFLLTAQKLDHRMMQVLSRAVAALGLKTDKIYFQSHAESFYYYMLYQPQELWAYQSILCDYDQSRIRVYRMECSNRTEPVAVFVGTKEYPFRDVQIFRKEEKLPEEELEALDREFLKIVKEVCGANIISSVYLIGEAYEEEWTKESLRFLCKNRRVFQGSNLYSKGACYGMLERLIPSAEGKKHVFLGNDKLKANVGLKVLRRGEESYQALLDAGMNWYEEERTIECYLLEDNFLELIIAPLMSKNTKTFRLHLEGLDSLPVRLKLHLYLPEETLLRVEAQDLGFGEWKTASNHTWADEIELY